MLYRNHPAEKSPAVLHGTACHRKGKQVNVGFRKASLESIPFQRII
jgi:hypothetical protein